MWGLRFLMLYEKIIAIGSKIFENIFLENLSFNSRLALCQMYANHFLLQFANIDMLLEVHVIYLQ